MNNKLHIPMSLWAYFSMVDIQSGKTISTL